ncbi:spore germination protein [Bacillus alveayuensis]|jgi:spore germination protein PF|uniref:Spore germination protein n=1 Tax=Aeribacillus alveayuensis TaxID=279215 RepID=A0ABT9VM96_9BACI|nr:spore germination protein [Bacillus alveayuensis]MDQ0162103.1 hypothetical protein [Bacillus alveayuensis]
MPAFVGAIEIEQIGDGSVKFGDTFSISPKATLKTAFGSGAFNTGDRLHMVNGRNLANETSPNLSDQPQLLNK